MNSDLWLEKKYINLLTPYLDRFKVDNSSTFRVSFRCPYCGDSKTNKYKTRGNVYESEGKIFFHCYNCGYSTTGSRFIKDVNNDLYEEFRLEALKNKVDQKKLPDWIPEIESTPCQRKDKFKPLNSELCFKVSKLDNDHEALEYLRSRKIPIEHYHRIYYSPKYCTWVNTIIPEKFSEAALEKDEPRIVLPFIDRDGYVVGAQGRLIGDKEGLRYISVSFDRTKPMLFGLEELDAHQRVYIVEGPIDSLFLPNSVAFAGGSNVGQIAEDQVIIFDNEPRNKDIIKRMDKYIAGGFNVCIWPSNVEQKDINQMILVGYSQSEVKQIIDENTFSGLAASVKISEWRRV